MDNFVDSQTCKEKSTHFFVSKAINHNFVSRD